MTIAGYTALITWVLTNMNLMYDTDFGSDGVSLPVENLFQGQLHAFILHSKFQRSNQRYCL